MTKRLAIFAHFDKDNVIDDYVIFYLKSLKKVCEKIIFVSACDLLENEKEKLQDIANFVIAQKHDEYDFGSYKRGFEYAKNSYDLSEIEEIVFANDSCYGPMYPFENVFDKMQKVQCDFWGLTENKFGIKGKARHIQSYFLVFRKNVFESEIFGNFISSITSQREKNDIIIKYEIGLSKLLFENDFVGESYVKKYFYIGNSTLYKWRELLLKEETPLLKTSILRLQNTEITTIVNWQKVIQKFDYPIELIKKNLLRLGIRKINDNFIPANLKILFFKVKSILLLPRMTRHKVLKLIKFCFPYFTD